MFSDEGRSVDQETLEYAWLLEIQLGRLTGKMTPPQVRHCHRLSRLTYTLYNCVSLKLNVLLCMLKLLRSKLFDNDLIKF